VCKCEWVVTDEISVICNHRDRASGAVKKKGCYGWLPLASLVVQSSVSQPPGRGPGINYTGPREVLL
jgi:hypothetical protein